VKIGAFQKASANIYFLLDKIECQTMQSRLL